MTYVGIVICRQHPGTAGGVTFLTMEDETGFVNLVIWRRLYEEYRTVINTSPLLCVRGKLQSEDGTVHLIAEKFWRGEARLQKIGTQSRDYR